jgi:uncharacterized membrane protein YqaE (UPF0057 family)
MYKNFIRVLFMLLAFTMLVPLGYAASLPVAAPVEPDPTSVKAAVESFSKLSKKEKKDRLKDVKKAVKEYKAAQKAGKEPSTNTLLLVILAILLPPLAVYLHQGEINSKFWIALLLTLLFWLPGVIYALVVILGSNA